MALSIKNEEADRLARELVACTGESLTTAVIEALRERLRRQRRRPEVSLLADLEAIRQRCARLPVLDPRPADEILGYDDHGVPT